MLRLFPLLFVWLFALAPPAFGQGTTPTFQVKTIADLLSTPIPFINNRITALVTGRLTTNDGGGGMFFYDALNTQATNMGTVFAGATGTGRWIREFSGEVKAEWFAVVGDTNSVNNTALQDAINYVSTTLGGGIVTLPKGVFRLTVNPITLKSNVWLRGQGMFATHLRQYTASRPAVQPENDYKLSDIHLQGAYLAGDAAPVAGSTGLLARYIGSDFTNRTTLDIDWAGSRGTIDNVWFSDWDQTGLGPGPFTHISNCRFTHIAQEGILAQGNYTTVQNCYFEDMYSWGIDVNASYGVFSGNTITNVGRTGNAGVGEDGGGIVIAAVQTAAGTSGNLVKGNVIVKSDFPGILVTANDIYRADGNIIEGNFVSNVCQSITDIAFGAITLLNANGSTNYLVGTTAVQNNKVFKSGKNGISSRSSLASQIQNNTVDTSTRVGILVTGHVGTTDTNSIVSGNRVRASSLQGISAVSIGGITINDNNVYAGLGDGISISTGVTGYEVTGNYSTYNAAGAGIFVDASTVNGLVSGNLCERNIFGVSLGATQTRVVVTGNGFYNNSSGDISDGSVGTASRWGNKTTSANFGVSEMTPGSVWFAATDGALSQDNATLFWDTSNKRLGLGTATPGARLHAEGASGTNGVLLVGASSGSGSDYVVRVLGDTGPYTDRFTITRSGLVNVPGLTASQLVATDGSKNLVSAGVSPATLTGAPFIMQANDANFSAERALAGTANQVILTDGGANSTMVLSTPQDIAHQSAVVFTNITTIGLMHHQSPGTFALRTLAAGRVIIGGASTGPTGLLVVDGGGGSVAYPQFTLVAQTLQGSPVTGSIEYDGTKFYATPSGTASTNRHQIATVLIGTATLDYDLTAVASEDKTVTVTGAAVGDTVAIGVPNGSVTADTLFWGWVSAGDTVTIRAMRTAGTPNPGSGTFKATVIKN